MTTINWVIILAALSAVETGDRDNAVGGFGEVSRYQIMPGLWQEHEPLEASRYTDQGRAARVAQAILSYRVNAFAFKNDRLPTAAEIYCLWHRPGLLELKGLEGLGPELRDRCERFANLVALLERREAGLDVQPRVPTR